MNTILYLYVLLYFSLLISYNSLSFHKYDSYTNVSFWSDVNCLVKVLKSFYAKPCSFQKDFFYHPIINYKYLQVFFLKINK